MPPRPRKRIKPADATSATTVEELMVVIAKAMEHVQTGLLTAAEADSITKQCKLQAQLIQMSSGVARRSRSPTGAKIDKVHELSDDELKRQLKVVNDDEG